MRFDLWRHVGNADAISRVFYRGWGMATPTISRRTGDPTIDPLIWGWKWDSPNLTYDAPTDYRSFGDPQSSGSGTWFYDFQALNDAQRGVMNTVAEMFSAVSGLEIRRGTLNDQASDLQLAGTTQVAYTPYTYWESIPVAAAIPPDPQFGSSHGDIFFNPIYNGGVFNTPRIGNYAFVTFIHEFGHAVGLKHGHQDSPPGGGILPVKYDQVQYSIMTYRTSETADASNNATPEGHNPQSLMTLDIQALQHLYGPDWDTNAGNTTYRWSPFTGEMFVNGNNQGAPVANKILLTVWDGGGRDTYDFSTYDNRVRVDLRPGMATTTSPEQLSTLGSPADGKKADGNVFNALLYRDNSRSLIENATGGSGNDKIIGNRADNVLKGGAGNDALDGKSGKDTLFGSGGKDRLDGSVGNDELNGGSGNDRLNGGSGRDFLVGNGGRDRLDGGRGNDKLEGGPGNDVFVFRHGGDVDRVRNFRDGADKIDLSNFDLSSAARARHYADEVRDNVVFDFGGGDRLIIEDLDIWRLGAGDFIL